MHASVGTFAQVASIVVSGTRTETAVRTDVRVTQAIGAQFAVFGKVLEAPVDTLIEALEEEANHNPALIIRLPCSQDLPAPTAAKSVTDDSDLELALLMSKDQRAFRYRRSSDRLSDSADCNRQLLAETPSRVSLYDHLVQQISDVCDGVEPIVHDFAEFLISQIDSKGYLPGGIEALVWEFNATRGQSGKPTAIRIDQAETALHRLKKLEPLGAVAVDLRDRLLTQLRCLPIPHPTIANPVLLTEVVEDHFDELIHNRLDAIARQTGQPLDSIEAARRDLRNLDPDPCRIFRPDPPTPRIRADVVVEQDRNGRLTVQVDNAVVPSIRIAWSYRQILSDRSADPAAIEFARRKVFQARQLIEAIEQRQRTLQEIAEALVEHQAGYIRQSDEPLKPLSQEDLARRLGKDPSTISRAVSGKWLQTPHGLLPMQKLFVTTSEVTATRAQQRIRELIDTEDAVTPLSDRQLREALLQEGMRLGRTTVAKYRRELGINKAQARTTTRLRHC